MPVYVCACVCVYIHGVWYMCGVCGTWRGCCVVCVLHGGLCGVCVMWGGLWGAEHALSRPQHK